MTKGVNENPYTLPPTSSAVKGLFKVSFRIVGGPTIVNTQQSTHETAYQVSVDHGVAPEVGGGHVDGAAVTLGLEHARHPLAHKHGVAELL